MALMASLAARGFIEHVVEANQRAGTEVGIYVHSWSPEAGTLLDALLSPNASSHEPWPLLDKVRSQHLSLKR